MLYTIQCLKKHNLIFCGLRRINISTTIYYLYVCTYICHRHTISTAAMHGAQTSALRVKILDQPRHQFITLFCMTQPSKSTETPRESAFIRIDSHLDTKLYVLLYCIHVCLNYITVWLGPHEKSTISVTSTGVTCPSLVFSMYNTIRLGLVSKWKLNFVVVWKYLPSVLCPVIQ